jgi:hypothetical protein
MRSEEGQKTQWSLDLSRYSGFGTCPMVAESGSLVGCCSSHHVEDFWGWSCWLELLDCWIGNWVGKPVLSAKKWLQKLHQSTFALVLHVE